MQSSSQIAHLIKCITGCKECVYVSEYCYDCFISGEHKKKTLIVMSKKLESNGVISINKPIADITHLDIIKNYKKLKQAIWKNYPLLYLVVF